MIPSFESSYLPSVEETETRLGPSGPNCKCGDLLWLSLRPKRDCLRETVYERLSRAEPDESSANLAAVWETRFSCEWVWRCVKVCV